MKQISVAVVANFSKKEKIQPQKLRKVDSDIPFILILDATKICSFTKSNHGNERL